MFGFKVKNWSSYGQFPELPQYLVDKSKSIRPAVFQELPASPQSSFYEAHPHQRQGERLCTLWIVKRRQRRQWKLAARTRRSAFSTEGHALGTGSQVVGGHVSSGIQKPSVSIAEPEDRKSVSLLGRVGAFKREEARLLSALFRRFNMQGTRGACTWQGSGFQIQTLRWENAEGDFLWAHFQLIPNHFTKHFISPKVLMKNSVVLVIFCVLLQQLRTCRDYKITLIEREGQNLWWGHWQPEADGGAHDLNAAQSTELPEDDHWGVRKSTTQYY